MDEDELRVAIGELMTEPDMERAQGLKPGFLHARRARERRRSGDATFDFMPQPVAENIPRGKLYTRAQYEALVQRGVFVKRRAGRPKDVSSDDTTA